jgi:hypothetical protein
MKYLVDIGKKTRVNESMDEETFGMLFFADIKSFDKELHFEI